MKGVYKHCGERHLHGYRTEFDFRYCRSLADGLDDAARYIEALGGIVGKRLLYRVSLQ